MNQSPHLENQAIPPIYTLDAATKSLNYQHDNRAKLTPDFHDLTNRKAQTIIA